MSLFRKHVYKVKIGKYLTKNYIRTDYTFLGICIYRVDEELRGICA